MLAHSVLHPRQKQQCFCIPTLRQYSVNHKQIPGSTYFCGLEHLLGWDLPAQVGQRSQQVIFALLWQLQDRLVAHDILNDNHPL